MMENERNGGQFSTSPTPSTPALPTRSLTAPLSNLSSNNNENLREESRRILEKFLQRELLSKGKIVGERQTESQPHFFGAPTTTTTSHRSVEFKFVSRSQPTSSQSCQYTAIRSDFDRVEARTTAATTRIASSDLESPIWPPTTCRQTSIEVNKSSQSTCSSSFRGRETSVAVDGSLSTTTSSSASVEEDSAKRKKTAEKKKKSLVRRVKERWERTMSLRRRRAAAAVEESAKKASSSNNVSTSTTITSRLRSRLMRSPVENEFPPPTPVEVLRSNSEESDRRIRLRFAELRVSSSSANPLPRKAKKRTRPRQTAAALTESNKTTAAATGGATSSKTPATTDLTPPDSGFHSNAKKRRKRDVPGGKESMGILASGLKIFKRDSASSGCSPTNWLRRKRQKPKTSDEVFDCRGLEIILTNPPRPLNQPGIVHRVSGELDVAESMVSVRVQPPSSSGSEQQPHSSSLTSPSWGFVGRPQSAAEYSQERPSSSDDMEEKYTLIAQRLAELGDEFLSKQWSRLRAAVPDDGDGGASSDRLRPTEREMVDFVNSCAQDLENGDVQAQKDIVAQLISSSTSQQFGRVLTSATEPSFLETTEPINWTRLAVIFSLTTAAVGMVGASTNAARRLIDYCCDYVSLSFSGWIIGQGGWSSVVEDQSSGDEDRSKRDM